MAYPERPTEMGGSQNSTFLPTSDVGVVVKRSNQIRIWGAEVKVAGLILAEPTIDELTTFGPELGHVNLPGGWCLSRASDRICLQMM